MKYRFINEHRHEHAVHDIKSLHGYKMPRGISGRPSIIAPNNLQRKFTVDFPDRAWVTDITSSVLGRAGYTLRLLLDLFSRMIMVVHEASARQRTGAGCNSNGRVAPQAEQAVLIHTDQGSQYGSDDWQRICREHNLESSMSRRGNCWANAVTEWFLSSLKKERVKKRIYKTPELTRADFFDCIVAPRLRGTSSRSTPAVLANSTIPVDTDVLITHTPPMSRRGHILLSPWNDDLFFSMQALNERDVDKRASGDIPGLTFRHSISR